MDERRAAVRERVIYGATASAPSGRTRHCTVRNISGTGARVVFGSTARLPDDIALTISRKGQSYQARVVWWRDDTAGVVFSGKAPSVAPNGIDLEERLRSSEKKARLLKRRVRELLGES